MYGEINGSISLGEVGHLVETGELDLTKTFFNVFEGMLTSVGLSYMVSHGQDLLNNALKLITSYFPPKERPFLSIVSSEEDLSILLAEGNIAGFIDHPGVLNDIFAVVTNANQLFLPKDQKLFTLINLLKSAKPENIALLMSKLSLRIFKERAVSVKDFMDVLASLNTPQASAFSDGVIKNGANKILLQNCAEEYSSEDFKQQYLKLHDEKKYMATHVLIKKMTQILSSLKDFCFVLQYLSDDQKHIFFLNIKSHLVKNLIKNSSDLEEIKGYLTTKDFQRLTNNKRLKTILASPLPPLSDSPLPLNDLAIENLAKMILTTTEPMTQDVMYHLILQTFNTSGNVCLSSKVEALLNMLTETNKNLFIGIVKLDKVFFLKIINNIEDIKRVFSNLYADDQRTLFFGIKDRITNIVRSSMDIDSTLKELGLYLSGDLIVWLNKKLNRPLIDELAPVSEAPTTYPIEEVMNFFKSCLLVNYCSIVLNRLIWESRQKDFPSVSTEEELTIFLKTRWTYFFDTNSIHQVVKILNSDQVFSESPLPRVIKNLSPIQINNFITPLASNLLSTLKFSNIDITTITYGNTLVLNVAQAHAFFFSLKTIAAAVMHNCIEQGETSSYNGMIARCDILFAMQVLRETASQMYFDIFIAPSANVLFESSEAVTTADPYDEYGESNAGNNLRSRLSRLFAPIHHKNAVIFKGENAIYDLALLYRLVSTTMQYKTPETMLFLGSVSNRKWRSESNIFYTDRASKEIDALYNLTAEAIAAQVKSVSDLEVLVGFFSTQQFEIICNKIRTTSPDKFTRSQVSSFKEQTIWYKDYRDIAIKIFNGNNCSDEIDSSSATLSVSQLQDIFQNTPQIRAFFKALEGSNIQKIQQTFNDLRREKSSMTLFKPASFDIQKFQELLRKLPEKYYGLLKAADIYPPTSTLSPC